MKKLVCLVSIIVLITFIAAIPVSAQGKSNQKTNIPYGLLKKLFYDSDEVKWAQKAIEKLMLKGLVRGRNDGKFYPKDPVTNIEAVVMALRVMDWEEAALLTNVLPKKYKGKQVDKWAIGYVAIAYEKGILDDVDMMYFDPNAPAKRHEVAKYVIRAIGKDDEAKEYMNADLPFADAAAVPQGSVGYVYLVNKLKIMTGDGKRFNPMGTLTRAEMAVLFCNLDDKVDSRKDENEYSGIVQYIDKDEIVIKIRNSNRTFEVSDDVLVYQGRERIRYSEIRKGSKVILVVEDDEVTYIELIDEDKDVEKIISRYEGELTEVKAGNPDTITVKIEEMRIIFIVPENAEIYFKGTRGEFDDLKAGDKVTVTVDDRNRARRIDVDREKKSTDRFEIQGKLTDIDLAGVYHITIDDEEYGLSKDATVKIDGKNARLSDLVIGMEIEAIVEDDVVISIFAEELKLEVKGIMEAVDSDSIRVLVDNRVREYSFADDMEIIVEGYPDRLASLEKGMKIELDLLNGKVILIHAQDNRFKIEGEIIDIFKSNNQYWVEFKSGGKTYEYAISEDVEIEGDDVEDNDVEDLEEGWDCEFEIVNTTIVKIIVED